MAMSEHECAMVEIKHNISQFLQLVDVQNYVYFMERDDV